MKCSSCGFENTEDALFCSKCGTKIELICPECEASLTPDSIFCNKCGHNLTQPSPPTPKELTFEEKLEKIQKYLPKDLTEKILSQRGKIEGERKQVTVMFCDLEAFTPLVEKVGADEAYTIMDQVYELLIHAVHDYGGTVNEMTGDGIMALFGAPIALEDAPQRAIRSAYMVHLGMSRFNDQVRQEREDIPTLKMRIGIHTGPVVVGTLGNDLRVEFKAVGDTVNLAKRMEQLAEPRATYVTEDTFKLTEGLFRFESLGKREVKGKIESINTYRVIGPSTRRTRFDVSAERGLTAFVGRERELEILTDAFERVKAGQGQSVSIVAEAGVGKSRLSYEFFKTIVNEDVTILEGKCLSYSSSVAYHPVIDVLKANFNVHEADTNLEIMDKAKGGLLGLGVEEDKTLPHILDLLSVENNDLESISLNPEAEKYYRLEAIKRIVLRGAEIRPLVISVEDLHWVDNSSEEIFRELLDSIAGTSVFLLFSYRTEYVQTWGAKSYHSQVHLNRFSNRESLSMLAYLLGTKTIDSELENLILEKTEGIPFFIEEFVKSLKDLNFLEQTNGKFRLSRDREALVIPSTIHDVIMARVDLLPSGAKELLQAGSAIEREFSHELIREVTGTPEPELLSQLSALKDSELIYERGVFPQSVYVFKHALTKEVVYDSILQTGKKSLHRRVADTIEQIYPEKVEEFIELLVHHYEKSENFSKAAYYSGLASKKSFNKGHLAEGISFAKKVVQNLEKLPVNADIQENLVKTRLRMGSALCIINRYQDAKSTVECIIDDVEKRAKPEELSRLYIVLGLYHRAIQQDYPKSIDYLGKARAFAETSGVIGRLMEANQWLGYICGEDCQPEKAQSYLMQNIEIVKKSGNAVAVSFYKFSLGLQVYQYQGKIDLAYETSADALSIAEESGQRQAIGTPSIIHGASCYYKGYDDEAESYLLQGLELVEEFQIKVWDAFAWFFLGEIYEFKGNLGKAREYFKQSIKLSKDEEGIEYMTAMSVFARLHLLAIKDNDNDPAIDLKSLLDDSSRIKAKAWVGWVQTKISGVLINMSLENTQEVEESIKTAIELNKTHHTQFWLGRAHALYFEFFKRQNSLPKAREQLTKAISVMKECGSDGWVERYEKELVELT